MAFNRPYGGGYNPVYNQGDLNNDGSLDRNEFHNMMQFQGTDRNRDGLVDFREFATGGAQNLGVPFGQVGRAFQVADRDNNGVLDNREMAEFSNFQQADINHDGRIDPFEMNVMRAQNDPPPFYPGGPMGGGFGGPMGSGFGGPPGGYGAPPAPFPPRQYPY